MGAGVDGCSEPCKFTSASRSIPHGATRSPSDAHAINIRMLRCRYCAEIGVLGPQATQCEVMALPSVPSESLPRNPSLPTFQDAAGATQSSGPLPNTLRGQICTLMPEQEPDETAEAPGAEQPFNQAIGSVLDTVSSSEMDGSGLSPTFLRLSVCHLLDPRLSPLVNHAACISNTWPGSDTVARKYRCISRL